MLNSNEKKMKAITYITALILMLPMTLIAKSDPKADTVIIELNKNSKIVIYTNSRADLADLRKYDINQMIRDLNAQLSDSVDYMEISGDEGKAYLNDQEVDMNDWKINDDEIKVKLGGMEFDVDPDEVDDFDEDDWMDRKRISYDADRVDRTTHFFNIDVGLNNWLDDGKFPDANNAPYAVKPFGSWMVGLNSVNQTWLGGPIFIEWGLGLNWYNWKMEDTDFRVVKTDTNTEFLSSPTHSGIKSKLTASYINAQLVPMFDFSKGRKRVKSLEAGGVRIKSYKRKGIRFGLGGYVGYRLGAHSKFIYKEDGDRNRDKEKDNFYLENLRYGLRAQIGWKGAEFFGTYDLNEVFSNGRGPTGSTKLNAITFGITL